MAYSDQKVASGPNASGPSASGPSAPKQHGLGQIGLVYALLVLVPSVAVGLYSLRYGFIDPALAPPGIRDVMREARLTFSLHALASAVALIVGPFQFIGFVRRRFAMLHRWIGRIYVAACLVGALAALALAPIASGGVIATIGFGVLALVWLVTTLRAFLAARRREFTRHQRLMLYSFAMTFAAVTLRIQIPIGIVAFGAPGYPELSQVLAFSSWLPNVLIVWLFLPRIARGEAKPAVA